MSDGVCRCRIPLCVDRNDRTRLLISFKIEIKKGKHTPPVKEDENPPSGVWRPFGCGSLTEKK